MAWACFVVTQLDEVELQLRRYAGHDERNPCPAMGGKHGYHNASITLGREVIDRNDRGGITIRNGPGAYEGDERWPTHCACGYEFAPDDEWQVYPKRIWRAGDGREFTIGTFPPGALVDSAGWDPRAIPGPDGRVWSVALPPGGGHDLWCIDAPSSTGGRWTRDGVAPDFTVSPSILTDRYHGFLQGGVLTDSLPDRPLT